MRLKELRTPQESVFVKITHPIMKVNSPNFKQNNQEEKQMMNMNKEMVIIAGGAILLTTAVVVGVRKIRKGKPYEVVEVKEEEIEV